MLVEGLLKSGLEKARSLAEEIAIRWITTNYVVYKKTGVMHEKFDVEQCGKFGGGGEYVPQVRLYSIIMVYKITNHFWSRETFKKHLLRVIGRNLPGNLFIDLLLVFLSQREKIGRISAICLFDMNLTMVVLQCRLVLAGRMELCWHSWRSLGGLKIGI